MVRPNFQLSDRRPRRRPRPIGPGAPPPRPHDFLIDVPERIVFGVGVEAHAALALQAMGAERVLIVCAGRRQVADRVADALGTHCVGVHAQARPHVPADDVVSAVEAAGDADWVLAVGGGSAVGLAKAMALRLPVSVAAMPTTYAGSERTDIWGITEGAVKTTGRDARVLPRLVLYDPTLTVSLPVDLSMRSLLNAMAHSAEALYAERATASARRAAADSLDPLLAGMRAIAADPGDLDGRWDAMYGAWLAGTALGGASMGLHHRICHVLGGTFGMPHATTHAVVLPHVLAFNLPAAPAARAILSERLGADPAAALSELARELGVPTDLQGLGLHLDELDRAAALVVGEPYPNPRPVTVDGVRALLDDAWHGRRPRLP